MYTDPHSPYSLISGGALSGPITLTNPGGPAYTGQSPLPFVILQNDSPYSLEVTTGDGSNFYVAAFTAQVCTLKNPSLTVTPTGTYSSNAPADLGVTWSNDGDTPPTSIPLGTTFTAVELTGNPTVDIAGQQVEVITPSGTPLDVSGSVTIASGSISINNTPAITVESGSITVPDAVLSGGGSVFGAGNPSFTIRDVSAYSYGYQNPTSPGGGSGTLVGSPPSGYNNTELHSLLIWNNGASLGVYNVGPHGGPNMISVELNGYSGFSFDFRGLSIGNTGLDFSCNAPGMLLCTYTWHA